MHQTGKLTVLACPEHVICSGKRIPIGIPTTYYDIPRVGTYFSSDLWVTGVIKARLVSGKNILFISDTCTWIYLWEEQ